MNRKELPGVASRPRSPNKVAERSVPDRYYH